MNMLFKFILFTFIVTTYVVVNPSAICHNDCEVKLQTVLNPSNHTNAFTPATKQQEPKAALAIQPTLNDELSFTGQLSDLSAIPYSFTNGQDQQNIVEGGIEGTGKVGDTRKLFEFNDEPLTPEEEIQKHAEEEDGIEGTGRMALGADHLIAYGPISRFGSIYVNGIRYQVNQAQIEFTNEQALSQLNVGMMVKVQADWKKIGHVPRKFSDDIWKRFKAACNHYFDRLHERRNSVSTVSYTHLTLPTIYSV